MKGEIRMKKALIAVIVVVIAVASFFAGFAVTRIGGKPDNENPAPSNTDEQVQNNDTENDAKAGNEMKEKAVFYSPNTGSDETGNATQASPVKTKEQAEKIAADMTVTEDEELIYLEYMMTVDVKTQNAAGVYSDAGGINMIPFTGSTDGYYFKGDIVGTGCDTQKYLPNDGGVLFSARYMLKGTDYMGQSCSIFIENNGTALDLCTPTIITDSRALADWQNYELRAIVIPVGGGVEVNVYRIHRD